MSELQGYRYEQRDDGTHAIESVQASGLQVPDFEPGAYSNRLDEINDSWRIIKDPKTGHKFEVAGVNLEHIGKDFVLFPSTEYSSLTQNIGNAVELAAHGAANPNTARVYVSYFGNGGSQNLPLRDRAHFLRTSRFTEGLDGSYHALPAVQAMARAVETHFGAPDHMSGDQAGARLAMGLMAAFDENSVKDAYLNGPPGVSHEAHYAKAGIEDVADRINRRVGDAAETALVVPKNNKEAKARLDNIYKSAGHNALWLSTYGRALPNVLTNVWAYSHHDDPYQIEQHALIQDALAALNRQKAVISMQFNRESMHHDLSACVFVGKLIMDELAGQRPLDGRGVELIIGQGGQDQHTLNPDSRFVGERRGLRSIATFMKLVRPGFNPEPQPQIAPAAQRAA